VLTAVRMSRLARAVWFRKRSHTVLTTWWKRVETEVSTRLGCSLI